MTYSVEIRSPGTQPTDCLIVGVYAKNLPPSTRALDDATDGYLSRLRKQGDLPTEPGDTLLLPERSGIAATRVLLVGCGKQTALTEERYDQIVTAAIRHLAKTQAKECECHLPDLSIKGRDTAWMVRAAAMAVLAQRYSYQDPRASEKRKPPADVLFCVQNRAELALAKTGLAEGIAIGEGMDLTRDLGNMPANLCTPTYLAEQAQTLAHDHPLKLTVLDQEQMEELKMGALLAVSRGSRQPPKLITLEYQGGNRESRPVVLVGKGITFDSGGISLKPGAAMDEMKYDMCGAASVFGTLLAVCKLKLPINLVGIIPACENLPDGDANKPGDVLQSMSGLTIEVLNTDAEGRLILADALTYAARYNPATVIDIATLTGACLVALGRIATGLLSTHNGLAKELLNAGQRIHDRAWQLPLWAGYEEGLKSNFADLANIGGREAGTITAASFLARFAEKYRWAHLDIAGTAWNSGKNKGATGRPVPLLTQFLIDQSRHSVGPS
ncbi:MAG: leucyl aminopeptidase [Gammaproteobacteria bacterium]|nr:leucyl aminopeptidase [Gammaproteobacteria bacterium]